jgi:hypothetical protein
MYLRQVHVHLGRWKGSIAARDYLDKLRVSRGHVQLEHANTSRN